MVMDYLDEETLIIDKAPKGSTDTETDQVASKLVAVHSTSAQEEFLRHFDKAENQLFNISSDLLTKTLKLSTLSEPEDLTIFREQLIQGINDIKAQATELTYPIAVIDKLCFLYAVVIDEFIIYSEWGEKNGWENKTLLSELFGMRNGGELFFSVAEKAARQPHKLIDLLEIIYLFINIGFKGQYREGNADQLKAFTYQLEQTISQYRNTSGVHCRIKVKLPEVRKPTRRKRYLITSLFFFCLIATSIGLTDFWYTNTHAQRARDFTYLPNFSQRYIVSGEVKDIVFISEDKDLATLPRYASKVDAVEVLQSNKLTPSSSHWLVQLATFSSKQSADAFIDNLSPSVYQPISSPYEKYYRVILRVNTKEEARSTKEWYVENDQINAIIVRTSAPDLNKEESN
ncbi:type IVB secretion system protein IcmH/DotU [Vibrio sp. 10N.261.46.E11]|uniref:type IVB secretion system protein IcmH/DotU n=1 Tax=Vibrio sp. 10N.261.46.E11 TaxID=3229662 RepID=UPI00354C6963